MEGAALLDMVCGPVGPLPETRQRYRLVSHLGTGGQAEVYRAVRVTGGVSSAPVTVKVFRANGDRPVEDQMRSWDKGDSVLMDLNSRGISGICRRMDGFYAPPPHSPDTGPSGDPVPYQVLDYLHGVTLREYVTQRYGLSGTGPRLDAVAALSDLAAVLTALHMPYDPSACPVLHMDVKPSNVMVLTGGEVCLIDFTGARYFVKDHITTVAYTSEAGGPEAFTGNVGPAYDVHGFGAVAYFLVTGELPRTEAGGPDGVATPPWSVLRKHPLLEANPALRDHLLAPVADRPEDRPATNELQGWVRRLAELVRASSCPDVGVDWTASRSRTVRRPAPPETPVAGTETGAFQRIERLERELVELRSALGAAPTTVSSAPPAATVPVAAAGGGPGVGAQPAPAAASGAAAPTAPLAATAPAATRPLPGTPLDRTKVASEPAAGKQIRGVATVRPKEPEPTITAPAPAPAPPPMPRRPAPDLVTVLNRGSEISGVGVMFVFVCWGIWSVASGAPEGLLDKFLIFVFTLLVGVGVFALSRLVGRLVWEKLLGRIRYSARGAHAVTAAYLAAAGLGFLGQTPWVVNVWGWFTGLV